MLCLILLLWPSLLAQPIAQPPERLFGVQPCAAGVVVEGRALAESDPPSSNRHRPRAPASRAAAMPRRIPQAWERAPSGAIVGVYFGPKYRRDSR